MSFFRSPTARTIALLGPALFSSVLIFSSVLTAQTATPAQCVDCHNKVTPNIVADWKLSKHSNVEVTCVTCHGDYLEHRMRTFPGIFHASPDYALWYGWSESSAI